MQILNMKKADHCKTWDFLESGKQRIRKNPAKTSSLVNPDSKKIVGGTP